MPAVLVLPSLTLKEEEGNNRRLERTKTRQLRADADKAWETCVQKKGLGDRSRRKAQQKVFSVCGIQKRRPRPPVRNYLASGLKKRSLLKRSKWAFRLKACRKYRTQDRVFTFTFTGLLSLCCCTYRLAALPRRGKRRSLVRVVLVHLEAALVVVLAAPLQRPRPRPRP